MASAFPLAWPDGWPRTPGHKARDGRKHFAVYRGGAASKSALNFEDALKGLEAALAALQADDIIVSSNLKLTMLGRPSGSIARPTDQAVAVYFKRQRKSLVFARDAFDRFEDNVRSITIALEAMRTLERHGGSSMAERAFTGFTALPPPKSCWEILGLQKGSSAQAINAAWRELIGKAHPDQGGSQAAAAELNAARDAALREVA